METKAKRRPALVGLATALILLAVVCVARSKPTEVEQKEETVAFFLIGDTHLLANKNDPAKLDGRSTSLAEGLIDTLNKLAGTEIPKATGGGTVLPPRGVVHAGDCIETVDRTSVKMEATEWAAFTKGFGLNGKDGRLKFPIYEVHGNHDSPHKDGLPIKQIAERNKTRPGVTNVSKNGLHYSWDWDKVHFVNLG